MNEHDLAVALGYLDGGEDHYWIPIELIPKNYIPYIESMVGWQAEFGNDENHGEGWHVERDALWTLVSDGDPLLEKLVEKQIIIECKRLGYAFDYHWWIDDKGNERHAAGYGMQGYREGLHTFRSRIIMLEDSVECSTKPAAHAAALIWLADKDTPGLVKKGVCTQERLDSLLAGEGGN